MVECPFRSHLWTPIQESQPGYEKAGMSCRKCGVGHTLEMTRVPSSGIRVDILIFPARGGTTVSREIIRFFISACEMTISEMTEAGEQVIRGETTILGEPTGI